MIAILFLCSEEVCFYCIKCIGLSPDLQSMEQIRRIMRPTDVPDTGNLAGMPAFIVCR